MLDFIKEKANCTGCTACYNACPVHCIEMVEDEEGFLYPDANMDRCIYCGKCEKVCPIYQNKTQSELTVKQKVVTARSKCYDTWFKSASGGAFSEICSSYPNKEVFIYGAVMDHGIVRHESARGVGEVAKFRKSKYVQSQLGDIFKEIKQHLDSQKDVIFSGTPCQIAGLKSFLRKDYDNLLLIDFICHGVGSPSVLRKCMDYVGGKYGFECIDYLFRQKRYVKGQKSFYVSFYSKADEKHFIGLDGKKDPYLFFFLSQLCLRPSCQENCRFRNSNRMSDITIADYKSNVRRRNVPILDDKNYSSIIFNTNKGLALYKNLCERMIIHEGSMEELSRINPLFFRTTTGNPLRNDFFNNFVRGMSIDELRKKYDDEHKELRSNDSRKMLSISKGILIHYINNILDKIHIF